MSSNLVRDGVSFSKPTGSNNYDAYAFKDGMTEITINKPTLSGHVRLGLTSDSNDDHVYGNGRYAGLFPNGRLYLPPFPDNTYTVDDSITVRLRGGRLSVLKNDDVLGTWDDNVE